MTIYVANFSTEWKDENLKALFNPFGQVDSATVMLDLFTDLSRGFGYVDMPDEEEGTAAIASLHGKQIENKTLTLKLSEPKKAVSGSYKVGSGGVNPYRFKKN